MGGWRPGVLALAGAGQRLDGRGHARRAQQVDLDGGVQGGVEGHCGGRVDDDVARGEHEPALVVEAESVTPDIAPDGPEPGGHGLVEAVAELVTQAAEAVVAHHLTRHAGRGIRTPGRAHEHHHLAPRDCAQEPFDEGGAEEAGGSRDEDALA